MVLVLGKSQGKEFGGGKVEGDDSSSSVDCKDHGKIQTSTVRFVKSSTGRN